MYWLLFGRTALAGREWVEGERVGHISEMGHHDHLVLPMFLGAKRASAVWKVLVTEKAKSHCDRSGWPHEPLRQYSLCL